MAIKKLFLDIETAPSTVYVWGLFNQNVQLNQIVEPGYTLCWAAKWEGEREIMFSSLQDGELPMVERIYGLLDEADAVIHYNGKKFDIPILNSEFLKHEMTPPAGYHQIDLLHTARKHFRLTSNKLDFVAQHLGLGQKVAHKGMELWRGCMGNNATDWAIMEKYNKQDVRLLPKLYKRLLPWIDNHPNVALWMEHGDDPICPNCGNKHLRFKAYRRTRVLSYKQYYCDPDKGGCGFYPRERFAQETGRNRRKDVLT